MKQGIGIIGSEGWVGKSMAQLFPGAHKYDEPQGIGNRDAINDREISFVCVPTPNVGEGKLDTSIVEEVVAWCESDIIVIRSTVNPGTSDDLAKKYNKNIVMQPEYLGETPSHPLLDPTARPFLILGGWSLSVRKVIDLYTQVYNANVSIRQVTAFEAEIIKLTENRAIAFKVAQCQELYDVCEAANVNYYTIRDAVFGDDPRFDLWFSFIYPGARGADSKCIPKDVYAWAAFAESVGVLPKITNALLKKNKEWVASNEAV